MIRKMGRKAGCSITKCDHNKDLETEAAEELGEKEEQASGGEPSRRTGGSPGPGSEMFAVLKKKGHLWTAVGKGARSVTEVRVKGGGCGEIT